jgi:cation transport ATPase
MGGQAEMMGHGGHGELSMAAMVRAIETSKKIDVAVMDKTGTLTLGTPQVTDLIVDGLAETDALALIAAVERESEHPLAEAVVHRADAAAAPKPMRSPTCRVRARSHRWTATGSWWGTSG